MVVFVDQRLAFPSDGAGRNFSKGKGHLRWGGMLGGDQILSIGICTLGSLWYYWWFRNPASTTWDGASKPFVNNGIFTTNLNWWAYRISEPLTGGSMSWRVSFWESKILRRKCGAWKNQKIFLPNGGVNGDESHGRSKNYLKQTQGCRRQDVCHDTMMFFGINN